MLALCRSRLRIFTPNESWITFCKWEQGLLASHGGLGSSHLGVKLSWRYRIFAHLMAKNSPISKWSYQSIKMINDCEQIVCIWNSDIVFMATFLFINSPFNSFVCHKLRLFWDLSKQKLKSLLTVKKCICSLWVLLHDSFSFSLLYFFLQRMILCSSHTNSKPFGFNMCYRKMGASPAH